MTSTCLSGANVNYAMTKLVGAGEFCCCREVANASGKMTFDGSIECISCITQHDYVALTNGTVLLQVASLRGTKMGERTAIEPEYQRISEFNSPMIRLFAQQSPSVVFPELWNPHFTATAGDSDNKQPEIAVFTR